MVEGLMVSVIPFISGLHLLQCQSTYMVLQVRAAFGAKHVIRVCSSEHKASALAAADRLLAHAERIRAQVDLTNASIAIDDCYQVHPHHP